MAVRFKPEHFAKQYYIEMLLWSEVLNYRLASLEEQLVDKYLPQKIFGIVTTAENDHALRENELTLMTKIFFWKGNNQYLTDPANKQLIKALILKYKIEHHKADNLRAIVSCNYWPIAWTFPEIVYNVIKTTPNIFPEWNSLNVYANFKKEHFNLGILGLMPANGKYGGFVKALILGHTLCCVSDDISFRAAIQFLTAFSRIIYKSTIAKQEDREKWFGALEITETDCATWNRDFDQEYPEYKDMHKAFDQII